MGFLTIKKAYISSDGGWFMDVFSVTDHDGNKSLGPDDSSCYSPRSTIGVKQSVDFTVIELTGADRPGLLSELCALLMDLQCNVVNAEIWTHRAKAATVLQVTDEETCSAVIDPERLEYYIRHTDGSPVKSEAERQRVIKCRVEA